MKLTVQHGKKDKIHILIDGVYQTTVDELYFSTCGVRDGAELTADEAAEFVRQAQCRRAFNKGVSLLSYQDRTRRQLLERLEPDYGEEAAEAAVDRLEELRLINDARYAETFAAELLRRKKMSPRRIRQELLARGIDRETADGAVDALECDTADNLLDLLQTKYRGKFADEKGVRRTVAALQRLGYGYGEIRAAMREAREDDGAEDEYED